MAAPARTEPSKALTVLAVVTALVAAVFVVRVAGPADASALSVSINRLNDGVAPFEDWAPGDTTTPTGDGLHQPGDDLDGANGIVRTLDQTRYRVEYAVNPPLPSGFLVLEVELTNAGVDANWTPGGSTCPEGSSFSADRSLWTCRLGVISGSSGTVAIDVSAVAPVSTPDGSQIGAQVRLTEDGDPATTEAADAALTAVSAAPRYELVKERMNNSRVTDNSLGETGLLATYFIGVRAADPDPRGLSGLPGPLSVTDHFGVGGSELTCNRSNYGMHPWRYTENPPIPDQAVSAPYATCTQIGDSLQVGWNVNWDRTAAPPTQGAGGGTLAAYAHGLVAYELIDAWIPLAAVDAADGNPGDGQGVLYAPNSVETSAGGVADPGTCSNYTWTPATGAVSSFDPDDGTGANNLGAAVETVADNGACTYYSLNVSTSGAKSSQGYGSSVVPDQDVRMYQYLYNLYSTAPSLPDRVACDKFDNSRFTLRSTPSFTVAGSPLWAPTDATIEFGIGPWGASYPGGAKSNDPNAWFVQARSDCSDATAQDLGGGVRWVKAADVDWTNSGGGVIDAEAVNMVRTTVHETMPAGRYTQIEMDFHTLADLTEGEELRNYSAFVVNASSTWTLSSCTGQNGSDQTCSADLTPGTYPGAYTAWHEVFSGVAQISKAPLGPTTLNAGDTNSWQLHAYAWPASTWPPGGWSGFTGSTDVVLDDILPEGFTYVIGSTTASTCPGIPSRSPIPRSWPTRRRPA